MDFFSGLLDCARSQERIVITADLDFPRLLAIAGTPDPSLILFRGGNYSEHEVIERLRHALNLIPPEDFPGILVVIERNCIRRRLPI